MGSLRGNLHGGKVVSQEESTASGMKNLVSWLKLGPEMVLPLRGPEFYSFFNT